MITADMIPDEVVWKLHDKLWEHGGPSVDEVRAAIAAALNAWPGLRMMVDIDTGDDSALKLPLPQTEEQTNED